MNFELEEEYQMLADLVESFVRDELLPLEAAVLEREAVGKGAYLTVEERGAIDARAGTRPVGHGRAARSRR